MATLATRFSGGGAPSPASGQVGTTAYQQVSPTSDPTFARLLEQIQAITPTALPGIESIVGQGMNSPLLQLVLGPMLERLQAPQAQQRSQLTEAARAAGGLRGSTYGQDFTRLQQQQGQQQNDLMSSVLQQVLGTLISGSLQSQQNSMLPGKALTDLLRTIAPQTVTGSTEAGGGGAGRVFGASSMSAPTGTGVSPEDRDAMLRGFPNAEAMRFQQMLGGSSNTRPGALPGVSDNLGAGATTTPYLDPFSPSAGGGWFDIGSGTQFMHSPATAQPTSPNVFGDWEFTPPQPGEWY